VTKYDLHCHSNISDGTYSPKEIIHMAAQSGIDLLALSDHDTMDGVPEAVAEGKKLGVTVLPAVELDNEWREELHILGLDVDPDAPGLCLALETARQRRLRRNAKIYQKLRDAGYHIEDFLPPEDTNCNITRLHIALALCKAGHAHSISDAFARFLRPGTVGYCAEPRYTPEDVIGFILSAGGIPVLAHPCHLKKDPHGTIRELVELGLRGLEAYYPSSTLGQQELFISLARQHGLLVTCGSDFHGKNRAGVPLGCTWQDTPILQETRAFLLDHHQQIGN